MNGSSETAVLFLSGHPDWANVGANFATALKIVGVPSVRVSLGQHNFNYPNKQIIVSDPRHTIAFVSAADVIVCMHSSFIPLRHYYNGRRLYVFHGGSIYRQGPQKINNFFNQFVSGSLIQTWDLMNLGAKNPIWMPPAVDTELLEGYADFSREGKNKIVIGHFPTSPHKGTEKIMSFLNSLPRDRFEIKFRQNVTEWEEHIREVASCDIYFDAMQPFQGRARYGCWGVAALEASACGVITISHFNGREQYIKQFGETPLISSETDADLIRIKDFLLRLDDEKIKKKKVEFMEWAKRSHSFQVVGRRLRNALQI